MKRARLAAGLTQAELASRVGVATTYVSRMECGDRSNPKADLLTELCMALGVTSDWLLGLSTTGGPPTTSPPSDQDGAGEGVEDAG